MFRLNSGGRDRARPGTHWRRPLAATAVAALVAASGTAPARADHAPNDAAEAHASVLEAGAGATPVAGAAYSRASSETDPGPNRAGVDPSVGNQTVKIAGVDVPIERFIDFGETGAVLSESTATSPFDTRAISGVAGADGAVTLDGTDDSAFTPATIDLLALLREAGVDGLTDLLVDQAELQLGIGGAEVVTENGSYLDPDGVGGPGRYRVGRADLLLGSPAIQQAAASVHDAGGRIDQVAEDEVGRRLDTAAIAEELPEGTRLTAEIDSAMQDRILQAVVAQPITTKNQVLTVDFSTGTATLHLDQALHGEEPLGGPLLDEPDSTRPGDPTGLNAQHPNTELIDDELYPMIAETVHDLMEEVTTIALGAVEGSLDAVTVTFTAANDDATATWATTLGGDGLEPVQCSPVTAQGAAACDTLVTAVEGARPVVDRALLPARDFLVGDAGAEVFAVAVDDIKTQGITVPVRTALEPVVDQLAKVVSLQVNHQRRSACTLPDGTSGMDSLKVSAFSLAVLRAQRVAVVDLGNAGTRVEACAPAARASIVDASWDSLDLAAAGHSDADPVTNPGPNDGGLDATVLGSRSFDVGGVEVPLDEVVDFGDLGAMLSRSTATSPYDAHAIAGLAGSDGSISLDRTPDGYDPATIDLLALMKKVGTEGLTDQLVDVAELRLGIGGAEVEAVDGTVLDPDGVGGPGQYRVALADLLLGSPALKESAAEIYDAAGRIDQVVEDEIGTRFDTGPITGSLPTGTTLTMTPDSDMQKEIFKAVVAKPITTKNEVLTVDFSTGTATLHLDKIMHGEEELDGPLLDDPDSVRPGDPTGINAQHPNTELVDDEIYPMIAETVHDLMDEVTTIVLGAAEGALDSVTLRFTAVSEAGGSRATARWAVNLGGDQVEPVQCSGQGLLGGGMCTTLTAAVKLAAPLVEQAAIPVRDFLVGDAGAQLFAVAVDDIKTQAITVTARRAVERPLELIAAVLSLQVNHQRTGTCTLPDGTRRLSSLRVSAVSVAVRRQSGAGRIDLGNAEVHLPCD